MSSRYAIKTFNPRAATPEEYRAFGALDNVMRLEKLPEDPPIPLEEQVQQMHNIPVFVDVHAWGVWNAEPSAIAVGSVSFLNTEENKHLGEVGIQVLPSFRRQGIARQLLGLIAEVARANRRTLLIFNTNERAPAGERFMERLGAERGLEHHANQLELKDLNRDLVRLWQQHAQERASGFELGLWEGQFPEQDIQAIAELYFVMNSAPRDQLQMEDFHFTPEHVRALEQSILARGSQRWAMYVRETKTGKFAGITEVFWNANRPHIVIQGKTGVFPQFRSKGLGRWLKAAMLDKILHERPEVKFVRTGNADSNAPMLKINFELGFKHLISQCVWQVQIDRVFEYLTNTNNRCVNA